ncbi:cytochrome c maturation protein CcmE domain-containing protein [Luteibaculum oceani]|uniref:Cytochrome c maturation protein CcmE n=1 Tax=Luteibaculum oceani TaxID=1294296 RepID=A0A5C6UYC7_9FLAO|nr:cytochrome c maturation protein CcmE [Luteibaculum oceani]TXC77056.1 cytochrome c maturation protein CcmE [Luteibaculum oceani]
MGKSKILILLVLATLIGFLISSIYDSSTYASLSEAFEDPNSEFHVVGVLDRSFPVEYNPIENAQLTKFKMVDNNGDTAMVYLEKSKPQDFERSENVVVIGKAKGEVFLAKDILVKCPSKYNEELEISTGSL